MTTARMQDILTALDDNGWHVVSKEPQHWQLSGGEAIWKVQRGREGVSVTLRFRAEGLMGEYTNRVEDLFRCDAIEADARLLFEKRNDARWRLEVNEFVMKLNEYAESSRASR